MHAFKFVFWLAAVIMMAGKSENKRVNSKLRSQNYGLQQQQQQQLQLQQEQQQQPYYMGSEYSDDYANQDGVEYSLPVDKRSPMRQGICAVKVEIVYPGDDTDNYEYRPKHYVTESCINPGNRFIDKCTETGLSCTQISRVIHITRRWKRSSDNKAGTDNNCWVQHAVIPYNSSCECMWPEYHIGNKHSYRIGK